MQDRIVLINLLLAVLNCILGSSVIGVLLTIYLKKPVNDKWEYAFEKKKQLYETIVILCSLYLDPENAKKYSIVDAFEPQIMDSKEIQEEALGSLSVLRPRLALITKDDKTAKCLDRFLSDSTSRTFEELVSQLRLDLFRNTV